MNCCEEDHLRCVSKNVQNCFRQNLAEQGEVEMSAPPMILLFAIFVLKKYQIWQKFDEVLRNKQLCTFFFRHSVCMWNV